MGGTWPMSSPSRPGSPRGQGFPAGRGGRTIPFPGGSGPPQPVAPPAASPGNFPFPGFDRPPARRTKPIRPFGKRFAKKVGTTVMRGALRSALGPVGYAILAAQVWDQLTRPSTTPGWVIPPGWVESSCGGLPCGGGPVRIGEGYCPTGCSTTLTHSNSHYLSRVSIPYERYGQSPPWTFSLTPKWSPHPTSPDSFVVTQSPRTFQYDYNNFPQPAPPAYPGEYINPDPWSPPNRMPEWFPNAVPEAMPPLSPAPAPVPSPIGQPVPNAEPHPQNDSRRVPPLTPPAPAIPGRAPSPGDPLTPGRGSPLPPPEPEAPPEVGNPPRNTPPDVDVRVEPEPSNEPPGKRTKEKKAGVAGLTSRLVGMSTELLDWSGAAYYALPCTLRRTYYRQFGRGAYHNMNIRKDILYRHWDRIDPVKFVNNVAAIQASDDAVAKLNRKTKTGNRTSLPKEGLGKQYEEGSKEFREFLEDHGMDFDGGKAGCRTFRRFSRATSRRTYRTWEQDYYVRS